MDDLSKKKEQSRIGHLRKNLYQKGKGSDQKPNMKLNRQEYNVNNDWEEDSTTTEEETSQRIMKQKKVKKSNFFKGLLIFSVLFFLASFGVAFYVFYGGINIVSTENVDLSIVGPSVIGGGEELSFQITVQNNNSIDLELADLIVDFPKGTLSADGRFRELIRTREPLGAVPAGGSITKIFKAVLFGGEGDKKDLIVTVEYRAEDSNAIFFKDRKYEMMIDSSPVGFTVNLPYEVMSGQEFEFSVDIVSNSIETIENLLFIADYPSGFELKNSNIEPVYKNNIWNFGDVEPNSERTLKIRGTLIGQDGEERVFSFSGGTQDKEDENEIRATLVSSAESIFIKKTLFGLDLAFDGDYGSEYITTTGEVIRGDILWTNNLPIRLSDVEVVAKLSGTVLNKPSVLSSDGYYKSLDNTITWDKENSSQLEILSPSSDGSLNFSFSPHSLATISNLGIQNPEIVIDITATGNKLSGDSVERVSTTISKKVKIRTDLLLTARALYSVGQFTNSGPLPPKVDKETTYTVVWTATNTSSDVQNAKVKASLPSYMRWLGVSSPQSEDISFNQVGGEIVWDIGSVEAGKGVSLSAREVSFQVALLPSLSQVKSEPILVKNISIEGEDSFTDTVIKYSVRDLTTRISTDPLFSVGEGDVIE